MRLLAPLLWLASLSPEPTAGQVVQLEWSAPEACPSAADVRQQIDLNLLGAVGDEGEALRPDLTSVRVRGSIEPVAAGWELRIDTTLPQGVVSRTVSAPRCEQLAEAAGLVVAVALDPLRVVETRREPASVPVTAPVPVPAPAPAPAPAQFDIVAERESIMAPPRQRGRASLDIRAGGLLEVGSFDVVRGGAWLGLGWAWPHARVDIAGQYWAPRAVYAFDAEPTAGVAVQQGGVAVRGCLLTHAGGVEFSTCAGLDAGVARGRGVGLGNPRTTFPPWVAATLGPELAWSSRRGLGVFLATDAMLHVVRPSFRVRDLGLGPQTHPVGFRMLLGPSWRL